VPSSCKKKKINKIKYDQKGSKSLGKNWFHYFGTGGKTGFGPF
jgi:hypothetical protein